MILIADSVASIVQKAVFELQIKVTNLSKLNLPL